MSNRAYLAASNADTIYPSFAEPSYDAPEQLIATDVEALPLLWLAMFREQDLQQKVFQVDGDDVPAFAPLCSKEQALKQLALATPYLCQIFPTFDRLPEYAELLRAAIEPLPYRFVSIELEEIAGLYPPEHRFAELLTLGLRGFDRPEQIRFECPDVTFDLSEMSISIEGMDGEEVDELNADDGTIDAGQMTIDGFTATSHAEVLERLANLRPLAPLPSARMYLDDLECAEDEQWNFTRVLGAGRYGSMGYGREAPWEKEDADFGWEFVSEYEDEDELEEPDDD